MFFSRSLFVFISLLLNISILNNSIATEIPIGTTIHSCGDDAGWPPYTYFTPTKKAGGYDVDILKEIFKKHGLESKVDMLPWKRCLLWAKHGKKYQMALSASYNKERDSTYLLTRHYYTVTLSYFYSKDHFPEGMDINTQTDFKKYKVCGLLGYAYANFGIPADDIEQTAKTASQVMEKIKRKRCDLYIDRYEIFAGFAYMGSNYIDDYNLGFAPVPGAEPEKFYLLISRNYEYAKELKSLIDTAIDSIENQGKLGPKVTQSIEKLKNLFGQ